jgi:hypothetical protein
MTRDELEHLLRAASRIAEDPDVVVVGSQAILGSFGDWELPDEAVRRVEGLPVAPEERDRITAWLEARRRHPG